MRAGDMRSRIRIESRSQFTDPDYGTTTETWSLFAEVWAEIVDTLPTRAEANVNGLRVATDQARVRIRFLPGVNAAMRIVELNGMRRTFQIIAGPSMTKWREELEMMVEGYSS